MPTWSRALSPWNLPWFELIEHSEWYRLFPDAPPFTRVSPLARILIRRPPQEIPDVLFGAGRAPETLLRSPLAELMTSGPGFVSDRLARIADDEVDAVLTRLESRGSDSVSAEELAIVLSPAADPHRRRLYDLARNRTRARFGGRVLLYAPLYVSNVCTNVCTYCGFNAKNPLPRTTLGAVELSREARALSERGMRHVLLLTGEAPKKVGTEHVLEAIRATAPYFATTSLEVFPMTEQEYGSCAAAGAHGLTLYQETYDVELYRQVHRGGRKRNLPWRLAGPERAARAGLAKIGIGALLGLGPWRYEALALGLHGLWLSERFPSVEFTLSFPRLRPAPGAEAPAASVADEELRHLMAALRLALPEFGFVLSTREGPRLRDQLASFVITQMSAGSRTDPGGYTLAQRPELAQFETADRRSISDVRSALCRMGLQPE